MNQKDRVFYRDRKKAYPVIDRGQGIYLYDQAGKKYIDAAGGPLVVNIGHNVPEVIDAMIEQAKKVCFPYSGHFVSEAQIDLSAKIIEFAPQGMSKVYFVSGGSEATEIALKFIRQYHLERGEPSRTKIITRWQSYHGGTIAALSLSGHAHYHKDYSPYIINFPRIQAPYCYRCRYGKQYPSCDVFCAHELERSIKQEGKQNIAAFISEPVTGATLGALAPPPEYFPIIREICDRYGILLVVDEVITGFGRTGKNFGIDHWGVVPDLIITGKGISSGYSPLGAVIVHEKVCDVFLKSKRSSFFTGYTYSGNPLSCAVGLAVLQYIEKHGLIERAASMGNLLFKRLSWLHKLPMVGDIRGKGLLLGVEIVQDKETKTPFDRSKKISETLVKKAFENGLILIATQGLEDGVVGDLIVMGPPFIVKENEINEVSQILEKVFQEVFDL